MSSRDQSWTTPTAPLGCCFIGAVLDAEPLVDLTRGDLLVELIDRNRRATRSLRGGLMLSGIALLGIVTASLATWLIEQVRATEETAQAATRRDIARLEAKLDELRALVVAAERT